ncbi:hypothetical protein HN873_072155 [Arachis hypogaea]
MVEERQRRERETEADLESEVRVRFENASISNIGGSLDNDSKAENGGDNNGGGGVTKERDSGCDNM